MTVVSKSFKYITNKFMQADWMIINGHKIQVSGYKYLSKDQNIRDGLEAPLGYNKRIKTPWGETEMCMIVAMPSLDGTLDFYATVANPKTNPGVRMSAFRVDKSLI